MKDPKKRSRIFSSARLVESSLLNRIGIQVFRVLTARLLYNLRVVSGGNHVKDAAAELISEGILVWPDFLPGDEFEALRREILKVVEEPDEKLKTKMHGSTISTTRSIGSLSSSLIPHTHKFLSDRRLRGVLEAVEKRNLDHPWKHSNIQLLKHETGSDSVDTQTKLHSDTFFSTHKLWLYLHDVRKEDGPFVYVKRSHRLSPAQLSYIYRSSQHDSSKDSRIVSAEEVARQGLCETIVTCKQNTLVIANTCGYHRRLAGEPGGKRLSVHSVHRANPFAPHSLRRRLSRHPQLQEALRLVKGKLERYRRPEWSNLLRLK